MIENWNEFYCKKDGFLLFEIEKERRGKNGTKGEMVKGHWGEEAGIAWGGPTISNGQAYIGVSVVCISNSRGCLERRFPKLRADTVTIG